jgi:hypothetical protein
VRAAFAAWLDSVHVLAEAKAVAEACLGRMLSLQLHAAWDSWLEHTAKHKHRKVSAGRVRERRDGALALSDLRPLVNQPPRKLGGSCFFLFFLLDGG